VTLLALILVRSRTHTAAGLLRLWELLAKQAVAVAPWVSALSPSAARPVNCPRLNLPIFQT
jgi:hypothetical protein